MDARLDPEATYVYRKLFFGRKIGLNELLPPGRPKTVIGREQIDKLTNYQIDKLEC